MPQDDQPGMFVSFESMVQQLSQQLESGINTIQTSLADMNRKLDLKASREHVDQVERRLQGQNDSLASVVKGQGEEIVALRVEGGSARGVSTTTLVLGGFMVTGIFGLIASLIYVVAQGHGGS